jgi:NTP pyrophosphatase (non-canonical NTP hydrolase)
MDARARIQAINELATDAHMTASNRGWWKGRNPTQANDVLACLMLVTTEVAEAAEEIRNRTPDLWAMGNMTEPGGKPVGFVSELADVCVRVFDLAAAMGIDLGKALDAKMEFNKGRDYRHGGKNA